MTMSKSLTGDWVDNLLLPDNSLRDYLLMQMEFVKMEERMFADTMADIESGDDARMRDAALRIRDFLDTPDPRKQFEERVKTM